MRRGTLRLLAHAGTYGFTVGRDIFLRLARGAVVVAVCHAIAVSPVAAADGAPAGRLPDGITPQTHNAIERGLAYLARAQARDGSWSNQGRYGAYPVAMTSLAGLALLMDGNTTTQGRYAPHIDRAAKYMLRAAEPKGLIARVEQESRPMYGHGFSMLFLSQLYGMTEDPLRGLQMHGVLSRAIELTSRAQSTRGGWYYTPASNRDEGSVTITQVQALRSCRNVGIAVPKVVIDIAMQYLSISQNKDGGIRYSARQVAGKSRPAITAAAVCCWFNAGEYANPRVLQALKYCKQRIKPRSTEGGHDYYAHFYFAQALYVSKDAYWSEYFPKRREFLLENQRPDGSWWGDGVGDIYGTAIALVILQLPYNQLPIMQQ